MNTAATLEHPLNQIPSHRKLIRYAMSSLSVRGIYQYALPLLGLTNDNPGRLDLSPYGELAGIFDVDSERMAAFNKAFGVEVPSYTSFSKMLAEVQPDVVIIAGPDYAHCGQIIEALQAGVEVITEKPMVITTDEAMRILEAEQACNRKVRVAFNFRHTAQHRAIKRIIQSGKLGKITNVEFSYNLDTYHGANYFKRWNRRRDLSGGLTVHKSCHHLDLIQWWVDSWPRQVFAYGARNYYGAGGWHDPSKNLATPLNLEAQMERCPYHQYWQARKAAKSVPEKDTRPVLPYAVQYQSPRYIYDADIDIEDTYAAVLTYENGVMMNYSCNFSAPWEGYRLGINGTLGRLETVYYSAPSRCPFPITTPNVIRVLPLFGPMEEIPVPIIEGAHGGADGAIQRDLFIGISEESQELDLPAGSLAGAYAVAAGEAIWKSVAQNQAMDLPDFHRMFADSQ